MRARAIALVLLGALAFYLALLGDRAVLLFREGGGVAVVLGVALLAFAALGALILITEVRFGRATERLGRRLAAEGGLPEAVPGPSNPRGERRAADADFEQRRREAEAAPQDWRVWYRLALAYGDAGDSARGRRAARRAIALERAEHDRLAEKDGRS